MTKADRLRLKDLMDLLLAHEPQVHYPLHDVRGAADAATYRLRDVSGVRRVLNTGGTLMMDCSQAATSLYKWTGRRDPSGQNYATGNGGIPLCYTGSLLANLRHYSNPSGAGIGALVVYGPATGDHVSVVYEPGEDPLLWSHGFDGGPQLVRLSVQRSYHRPPVTFLNVSRL